METEFIRTVSGDIPPQQMGICGCWDQAAVQDLPGQLLAYQRAGGGALVAARPMGCGRREGELAGASQVLGVHILAATGYDVADRYEKGHWLLALNAQALSHVFIEEITRGMCPGGRRGEAMGARAGAIHCASAAPGLKEPEKSRLEAAALASLATGAPLLCSAHGGGALEQARFLIGCGVEPQSILMMRQDGSQLAMEECLWLAEAGVYLVMDFTRDPEAETAKIGRIKALFRLGFGAQLMVGLDPALFQGALGDPPSARHLLPRLLRAGITRDQLRQLTVDTPAWALAMKTTK